MIESNTVRRIKGARIGGNWMLSWIAPAVLFVLWFAATNLRWVDPFVLPTPQAMGAALWDFLLNGYDRASFLGHLSASLFRTTAGIVLGLALAIPVGLVLGYSKTLYLVISPIFNFLRPIPAIAYLPLIILYMGIGETTKVFVIALAVFLYTVLNTSNGVRSVPTQLIGAAENLGLNRRQLFIHVILPGTMPFIIVGVKMATAVGWALVVAAELVAAQQGLGYVIMNAATFFNIPLVYIGIALIGIMGIVLELLVRILERRYLHWQGK